MTNRINGDFNQDSMEAFRAAYAAQLLEPEDQEIDSHTGLPSNVVLNTSPWIQHTGLWKANDGTDKYFVPNQVLVPGEPLETSEEVNDDGEEMTDEELDALLESLLEDGEDDDLESLIESLHEEDLIEENFDTSIDQSDLYDEEDFEEDVDVDEAEIDALIAELEAELELGED